MKVLHFDDGVSVGIVSPAEARKTIDIDDDIVAAICVRQQRPRSKDGPLRVSHNIHMFVLDREQARDLGAELVRLAGEKASEG